MNTYVNSFAEYAKVKKIHMKKKNPSRTEKTMKCFKCGAPMKPIEGSNIIVCTNMEVEKDKNGKKITEPCGNFIIQP